MKAAVQWRNMVTSSKTDQGKGGFHQKQLNLTKEPAGRFMGYIYPLVMPWKDPPFLSSVNHLFLWAIYTMAMLVITRGYI